MNILNWSTKAHDEDFDEDNFWMILMMMYWKILRKCVFLFHICVCPTYLFLFFVHAEEKELEKHNICDHTRERELEKHGIFNRARERELEKHGIFNHTRERELEKHSIFNRARERELEKHSIFNHAQEREQQQQQQEEQQEEEQQQRQRQRQRQQEEQEQEQEQEQQQIGIQTQMWNRKTHLRNIFQYIIIKIIQKSSSSKSSSWALVDQFKMFNARLSPNSYLRTICANVEQKVKLTIRYRLLLTTTPHTVDGRIIQSLIHRATPLTPNINVIFLLGSFLRMDEINQTLEQEQRYETITLKFGGGMGWPITHG